MHPLSGVGWSDAYPFLRTFGKAKAKNYQKQVDDDEKYASGQSQKKKAKPNMKAQMKDNMSKAMMKGGDEQAKSKDEVDKECLQVKPDFDEGEDPFLYLGFGIVSYFDLIKVLIWVFLILTLVNTPNIMIFQSYSNYSNDMVDRGSRMMTMGNMGFSTPKCVDTGMATNNIIMSCKTGYIAKVTDFGINAKGEDKTLCRRNQVGACANALSDNAKTQIETCKGKESCKVANIKDLVKGDQKQNCASDLSSFFVQFMCHQTPEVLEQKRKDGAMLAATSTFSALFFMIAVFYLRQSTALNKIQWDVETVTAADYTVELDVRKVYT
jgi:hypothetical protein